MVIYRKNKAAIVVKSIQFSTESAFKPGKIVKK